MVNDEYIIKVPKQRAPDGLNINDQVSTHAAGCAGVGAPHPALRLCDCMQEDHVGQGYHPVLPSKQVMAVERMSGKQGRNRRNGPNSMKLEVLLSQGGSVIPSYHGSRHLLPCCAVLCVVQVQLSNGLPARVSAIDDGEVTLDLNHELAGKHLTFDVTLQSLVPSEALQKATFGAGCFWG
jgi:hypothetical protein